jgi:uroporphyrinogen-III synthase
VDEARRPLAGRSVWLTRPAERVRTLAASLERLGASVTARPTIAFEPTKDPTGARRAVERLAEYGWVVFTSANGVRYFRQRMRAAGRTALPVSIRVAAIGPATGRELERSGLDVDLIAEDSRSEGLAAALTPRIVAGERVLVVGPEVVRPVLPDTLRAIGARAEAVAFYRNVPASGVDALAEQVRADNFDAILFSSPSSLERLLEADAAEPEQLREALARTRLLAIGPVTAEALRRAGFEPAGVAGEPTDEAVVRAVCSLFA